jgi:DNA polymerase zeta
MENAQRVCASCTGCAPLEPIHCDSIDCQWFYARHKANAGLELVPMFEQLVGELETLHDESESEFERDEEADSVIYVDDIPSAGEEVYETGHYMEE